MALAFKRLGQGRWNDANQHDLATLPAATQWNNLKLTIANTTGTAATYRICHDEAGTTFDATTALAWDVSLPANTTVTLSLGICSNTSGAKISVQNGTGNALTFTLYGMEIT